MVSLARKNLFEDVPRLLVAQAGIMFAVILTTVQVGLLRGFTHSTTLLIERSKADLWVASPEMVHFELTGALSLRHVSDVRQIKGVAQAEAMTISTVRWRTENGQPTVIRLFGFNPDGSLFVPGDVVEGKIRDLHQPYSVIVDQVNSSALNLNQVGDVAEVVEFQTSPVKVVGFTQGTQSVASSAYVFTSLENAKAYSLGGLRSSTTCKLNPDEEFQCETLVQEEASPSEVAQQAAPASLTANDPITYILIRVEPTEDPQVVQDRLKKTFSEFGVYTTDEMVQRTQAYWQRSTGIGLILGLGAAVGVVVGIVTVSQILYSSVSDHIKEFATLKAMGASDLTIYSIILEQAMWMSVLGYIPGMAICIGLGIWTTTYGILIFITPITAVGVFALTVGMCISSAVFAIQKVMRVDPGMVFKA